MQNKNYHTTIVLNKTPEYVFECISDVSSWWSKDFEGNSKKLNDSFVICHPTLHYSKQQLIAVVPGKGMVWLVAESELAWLSRDKHEWTNTKMIFDIRTDGNNTILDFMHEGLTPEKECYHRCEQGWNKVIKDSLFLYIMEGKSI